LSRVIGIPPEETIVIPIPNVGTTVAGKAPTGGAVVTFTTGIPPEARTTTGAEV